MTLDIEVNNVSMKYKNFEALKSISFKLDSVDSGKIYGLLGRNGAGKTSLLSLLPSFREPTEGSIKIGGEAPFENAKIMQHVDFIYEVDYKDEYEKVKKMIESAEEFRPNFDMEYANKLA